MVDAWNNFTQLGNPVNNLKVDNCYTAGNVGKKGYGLRFEIHSGKYIYALFVGEEGELLLEKYATKQEVV